METEAEAPRLTRILGGAVPVLLGLTLTLPLWPAWLGCRLVFGRPPTQPSLGWIARLMRAILTEEPPAPGIARTQRAALLLAVLTRLAGYPLESIAHGVDRLLFGRALARVRIVRPLIEISAARSGSTQLAHHLHDDPSIVAPSVLQSLVPFVWLWRVAGATIGRWVPRERIRARVLAMFPKEYLERHELDPFQTDTFEILYSVHRLVPVVLALGPRWSTAMLAPSERTPENQEYWDDFVAWFDDMARKTLLQTPGQLLIKGHFLAVASELEERYPDARFLTMVRPPAARIRSTINFHRCQPRPPLVAPTPWPWLVALARHAEVAYCRRELAWFGAPGQERRIVLRFEDYVNDLPGTLREVYTRGLGRDPDTTLPLGHAPRKRHGYSVDRTLDELGIDAEWLAAELGEYDAWSRGRAGARERKAAVP